jgi:hypothetical protein
LRRVLKPIGPYPPLWPACRPSAGNDALAQVQSGGYLTAGVPAVEQRQEQVDVELAAFVPEGMQDDVEVADQAADRGELPELADGRLQAMAAGSGVKSWPDSALATLPALLMALRHLLASAGTAPD